MLQTCELLNKSRFKGKRYSNIDHLLKSNVLSDENAKIGHDNKRDIGSTDFFMPIDNDLEADVEIAITFVP